MRQYQRVLRQIYQNGILKPNRTGMSAKSAFGFLMEFDLSRGFPILTTKKIHLKSIIMELIWFIRGDTNIKFLNDRDVRIWNQDAYRQYKAALESTGNTPVDFDTFVKKIKEDAVFADNWGDLGPIYGRQWRRWKCSDGSSIDQLARVVERIKTNPNDRRLIVTAWNPEDVSRMALPPCHCLFQFFVADGRLDCLMYQRSCDMFLGVPFNISSYALLTILIAKITGLRPGWYKHVLGDAHIYQNHFEQTDLLLSREPRALPQLILKKDPRSLADLENLEHTDFELVGYDPHPAIAADLSTG